MFRPDDEDRPFIARWNLLTRILLVGPTVKLVARMVMDYADFNDGSSCHPSNERLARETGLNERTVRNAWATLRGLGMAERIGRGVPHERLADEYELQIPPGWESMPILGPHGRKFRCPGCGKLFTPDGNNTVNAVQGDKPDSVRFNVGRLAFCPAPRQRKGRDSDPCMAAWNRERPKSEKRWAQLDGEQQWAVFRQARGDDW